MVFRSIKFVIRTRDHLPPHVHVIRGAAEVKIEILTRRVIRSRGFGPSDLKRISEFVASREQLLMEAWNEIHKKED